MSAPSGGIIIDCRQAMPPDSPAVELEVVGSSSPSVTPYPAAAARADADIDHGGGAAEFEQVSDQQLQVKISRCEGMVKQGILKRTPDGGEKMQACLLRMKKEVERRRAARQWKDDTVLRQAVHDKRTGGSRGEIYDFKSDETMDSTASKYYPNSNCATSTKTYTQVKGAPYKERSSLSHGKCAYPKNGGQISKESLNRQLKTCADLPKSRTISQQENSTVGKHINATFGSNRRWNLAENKASPSLKMKKDVVLLDDDDDTKPARSADVQISNKWDESKIHYPSSTDPEAVEVSYSDMKCLEPEEYLKSPVINFCLKYLKKSRPRRDLYMFNTYFYSKLEEALSTPGDHDLEFSKLRRWWRSVDIFKQAYIILPINETMHWSLIIVCMPTKEADSGPMMLHLDSLGLHSSQKLFDIVRRYIQAEWRHLQKDSSYDIPFSRRIWKHLSRNINGEKVEVPRQRNDYDCGLFMLYYIDRFIQEAPERLTKEGLGMFGRRWFNHAEASALRQGIRELLFELFHSALGDDGPSEPELHPGEGKDTRMA